MTIGVFDKPAWVGIMSFQGYQLSLCPTDAVTGKFIAKIPRRRVETGVCNFSPGNEVTFSDHVIVREMLN